MNSLDRLVGFYWVARTGGYASAVRAFPYPITAPGVHQQVHRLEAELGVRLFTRAGKGRLTLTAAGRTLHEVVAPFVERLPQVVASIREGRFGGTLRVGAPPMIVQGLLPTWLRRLQHRRPDVEVALSEVRAPDPTLLLSGELDLLVDHLSTVPPSLEVRTVANLWVFLALPATHPLAGRRGLDHGALREVPFIAYQTDEIGRRTQLEGLVAAGGPTKPRYTADSAESILGFVAAGLGFSVIPWLDANGPRRRGVWVQRVRRPEVHLPVYAAWRRGAANPLVEAALEVAPLA